MSQAATFANRICVRVQLGSSRTFTLPALGLLTASALLAGWLPIGFSIVTVFLFAGPHNWLELRYFMTRLPGRWGPLRGYFLFGLGGVLALTAAFAAFPWLAEAGDWDGAAWFTALAAWNSALVFWIAALVYLRSQQKPVRDWSWVWPVSFGLAAVAWIAPAEWGLGLVYLHPLMALWILDRELRRRRSPWRGAYHCCLLCVPLALGLLWWRLAGTPDLPGDDALKLRITRHAGAGILHGVSTHLLVATHTFLEMLHYGVWLILIPLVGIRSAPWRLDGVPMAQRSLGGRRVFAGLLVLGLGVVVLLWGCFLADYPLTRDVYFTVALLHVLAEVPFLLRAL